MPTQTSQIDICNLALAACNQKSILSLADPNELARQCVRWYDPMRRELLESCDWSFARNSAKLNLVAAVTGFGETFPDWAQPSNLASTNGANDTAFPWAYVYQYPVNVLYVHKVFALATGFGLAEEFMGYDEVSYVTWLQRMRKQYEIRRSRTSNQFVICCNLESALAKWTADIQDTSQFTQKFCTALALKMASMMVSPLTGDLDLKAQIKADLQEAIGEAFRLNLSENPEHGPRSSAYEDVRGL